MASVFWRQKRELVDHEAIIRVTCHIIVHAKSKWAEVHAKGHVHPEIEPLLAGCARLLFAGRTVGAAGAAELPIVPLASITVAFTCPKALVTAGWVPVLVAFVLMTPVTRPPTPWVHLIVSGAVEALVLPSACAAYATFCALAKAGVRRSVLMRVTGACAVDEGRAAVAASALIRTPGGVVGAGFARRVAFIAHTLAIASTSTGPIAFVAALVHCVFQRTTCDEL